MQGSLVSVRGSEPIQGMIMIICLKSLMYRVCVEYWIVTPRIYFKDSEVPVLWDSYVMGHAQDCPSQNTSDFLCQPLPTTHTARFVFSAYVSEWTNKRVTVGKNRR